MRTLQDEIFEQFYEAILNLESVEECKAFFHDVATVKEINDLAQRLQVAKMLKKNYKYQEIEETTGASTATISRVNRFLKHGYGGYEKVLEKLLERGIEK